MTDHSRRDVFAVALGAGLFAGAGTGLAKAAASDPFADLDGMATAEGLRSGRFSPAEVTEAAITRTAGLNPRLGAVVTPMFDQARRAARAVPLTGRLAGVPTMVKDLVDVKGAPTRQGSRAFDPIPASTQSPFVDAMEAGGMVILGKSQTPELGASGTTEPLLGPVTRNPWDLRYSTGGSSGGSAAAVAARLVPLAHGTDAGGSLRMPASHCGIFALKVSRGRTLSDGRPALRPVDMSVGGAMSRSVRDSAAFLALVERRDAGAPLAPVGFVEGPASRRLKIGFSLASMVGVAPDPEVVRAIEEMAGRCKTLGHSIHDFAWPFDTGDLYQSLKLSMVDGFVQLGAALSARRQKPLEELGLEPLHLQMARTGSRLSADERARIEGAMIDVATRYDSAFEKVDLVLTPVLGAPPPPLGYMDEPGLTIDQFFERGTRYGGYTPIQNVGGGPAMSVPAGFSAQGLPIGAHFAGPSGAERVLLELAYELEQAAPWSGRRPPLS